MVMFPLSCIICACMLYYCDMMRWARWDWELSGWVIRPVKIPCPKWPILCRVGR